MAEQIDLTEALEAYKIYLEKMSSKHLKKLLEIERANPQAARAEAAVFNILKGQDLEPEAFDDPNKGGPDFICNKGKDPFLVEVTSLVKDIISQRSGIPPTPKNDQVFDYQMITDRLEFKAEGKLGQMDGHPMPRVLAITCEQWASGLLLDANNAEILLTGGNRFHEGGGKPEKTILNDLENVAFMEFDEGKSRVISIRQSISAILLIHVHEFACQIYGLVHPDPEKYFFTENLEKIPFVRITNWPFKDNEIKFKWSPNPKDKGYFPYTVIS